MQEKFLTQEEYQNKFGSGEQLTFDTKFPFTELTASSRAVFMAWHWDIHIAGSTGTAYACRMGNITTPLKFDVCSFRPSEEGVEIINIKTDYHHIENIDDIPQFIKEQAPDWVVAKIEEVMPQ